MHRFIASILAVVFGGCASAWQSGSGPVPEAAIGVSVDVPPGWYQIADAPLAAIAMTKNGISIETITVSRSQLDQKLPNSPQRFQAGMSPSEAADVDISNHEFAPGIDGFEVIDRGVATVDGQPCYYYSYKYLESFGQPRNVKDYGCILAPYLYRFHYTAPAQKWFAELLPAFEAVVSSAKFASP
jgi:hypothetical protein